MTSDERRADTYAIISAAIFCLQGMATTVHMVDDDHIAIVHESIKTMAGALQDAALLGLFMTGETAST